MLSLQGRKFTRCSGHVDGPVCPDFSLNHLEISCEKGASKLPEEEFHEPGVQTPIENLSCPHTLFSFIYLFNISVFTFGPFDAS